MKAVQIENSPEPVMIKTRKRLLDAMLDAKVDVAAACGGKGLCATCHCYVEQGEEQLTPRTKREEMSLKMLADNRPNSRLACQAKVIGDGVVIRRPHGSYIESTSDLEALIGRRAEQPILHPVTGRILIDTGKIITRSRVEQLASVDVDVEEMRRRSLTAGG